jgi:hypothetical protein
VTPPTYQQLLAAPELASLALLEASLEVAALALAAAWPELHDLDIAREGDETRAALLVLHRSSRLVAAIHTYRIARVLADCRPLDLPF